MQFRSGPAKMSMQPAGRDTARETRPEYPNGVSTKVVNRTTRYAVIQTHERRCRAAGKRAAYLVEAGPTVIDALPSGWAFDGPLQLHTYPLLPLKQVHDTAGHQCLLAYLPGGSESDVLSAHTPDGRGQYSTGPGPHGGARVVMHFSVIIMDTGHSNVILVQQRARPPRAFGWPEHSWHVVSLISRESAAAMLDMPGFCSRPHTAAPVPVEQVPEPMHSVAGH